MILTKAELNKLKADEIAAISIAESGAMGRAGETIVITSKNTVLNSGSIYEENPEYVGPKLVLDKIEALKNWNPGFVIPGYVSKINYDWYYICLGFGNHLLVKEDFYNLYKSKINTGDFFTNYRNWNILVRSIESKENN